MQEIIITAAEANQRLDKFLLRRFPLATKGLVYKLLRKKRIKYNGGRAEGNELLQTGDCLSLYLSAETIESLSETKTLSPVDRTFGIVFENDALLLVNKPPGLLTHPDTAEDRDTLIQQAQWYLYETGEYTGEGFAPATCNRLDRNTAGLVLIGKTLAATQAANRAIPEGQIAKTYLALTEGEVTASGEVLGLLKKDKKTNQVFEEEGTDAKQAHTSYAPLWTNGQFTLMQLELITGRTHQLRAHMQQIGHPIVGDSKYGNPSAHPLFRKKYGLSHQLLLSWRMRFLAGQSLFPPETAFFAPMPPLWLQICKEALGGDAIEALFSQERFKEEE